MSDTTIFANPIFTVGGIAAVTPVAMPPAGNLNGAPNTPVTPPASQYPFGGLFTSPTPSTPQNATPAETTVCEQCAYNDLPACLSCLGGGITHGLTMIGINVLFGLFIVFGLWIMFKDTESAKSVGRAAGHAAETAALA